MHKIYTLSGTEIKAIISPSHLPPPTTKSGFPEEIFLKTFQE